MASVRKREWKTAKGETRVGWSVDFVDAAGNRQRRQFSSKREATAERVKIESQLRAGTFRPDASKVTVREACDAFLDHCRGRRDRGERMTRRNYAVLDGHCRNHILHPERGVGSAKLGQFTARAVGEFRDRLRDAGISVPTTRKIIGTLHNVLQHAIGQDLIAVNAAHGIKVIGRRDEGSKKIVPPTKEALRALIEVADPDFRVQLIVAAATGLRAGEHHALRWRHVDLEAGEITVDTRVDAYGEEDTTKTAAGVRTVPLGHDVAKALKAWKLRSKFSKSDHLVFPNRRGGFQCHDNVVKRRFKPLFNKLATLHDQDPAQHPPAPERFNWHALRHFAVSCWIDADLSPKTVQTFAGHSSLQVTMDRYGHMFKSDDHRRAMDEIAKSLF